MTQRLAFPRWFSLLLAGFLITAILPSDLVGATQWQSIGWLATTVVDRNGRPVDAIVVIRGAHNRAGSTNRLGQYVVTVPPGRYRVSAVYAGQSTSPRDVTVLAGQTRRTIIHLKVSGTPPSPVAEVPYLPPPSQTGITTPQVGGGTGQSPPGGITSGFTRPGGGTGQTTPGSIPSGLTPPGGEAGQTVSAPAPSGDATSGQGTTNYYGTRVSMGGLGNIYIGKDNITRTGNVRVSTRFRAGHTGALVSFRSRMATVPGYADGNGGTIRVELQTDDGTRNHFPSGTVLGSFTTAPNAARRDPPRGWYGFFDTGFTVVTLSPSPALVRGEVYHLVWSNIAADPVHHYISWDGGYIDPPVTSPRQPTYSDVDLSVLISVDNAPWIIYDTIVPGKDGRIPLLQLNYADGFVEGRNGYEEVDDPVTTQVSGVNQVRESFAVANLPVGVSSAEFTSVSVRILRQSGNDPLTIRLEKSNGTLVVQGQIPASSFPDVTQEKYVTLAFPTPVTLVVGQAYNLVLQAPSTSVYKARTVRDGRFADPSQPDSRTYFADGHAQQNTGTGWGDYVPTRWGVPRTEFHLQFYFESRPVR